VKWWENLSSLQKAIVAAVGLLGVGGSVGAACMVGVGDYVGLPDTVDSMHVQVDRNTRSLDSVLIFVERQDSLVHQVEFVMDTLLSMGRSLNETNCVVRQIALDGDPRECLLHHNATTNGGG